MGKDNNYLSWFMWKLLGAAVRVAMYKQVFSVLWLVTSVRGGFYFDSLWISFELIWISRSRWSFISWPHGTTKIIHSGEQFSIISTILAWDVLMADFQSLVTRWSLKFGKTIATSHAQVVQQDGRHGPFSGERISGIYNSLFYM